ncbi:MAG TPA: DUF2442 domain-containing protein [Deltaproteobacteria bacterium]|nr:DUF2442 domain-containing protein [Deltaproteobacteria bacterium]
MVDTAYTAHCEHGHVVIEMESGVIIRFPITGNRRLTDGTKEQLNNIEISPYGLHWPDLDEDLSFRGLLAGDYGQYAGSRTSRCSGRANC